MGETMGTEQDRSLDAYVQFFDAGVSRLSMYVGNLQDIEGRFRTRLHGTTPSNNKEEPSDKHEPSLESSKQILEKKLNELEEVISALSKNVAPTGNVAG